MIKEIVKSLPKIELHCHLDGSISIECVKKLILSSGDSLPGNLNDCVRAPAYCNNLKEYLRPFPFLIKYLQSSNSLEIAAYDVIAQAALENVIYIELRFSPILHCQSGLDCDGAVKSVLNGIKRAERDFSVQAGVILCLMRGDCYNNNKLVVDSACRFYGNGVVAVDLAGNEDDHPPREYIALFKLASENKIPLTIHAGEKGPPHNVLEAVEMGASRIGHGLALASSPKLRRMCCERNILLELCPVSNLQTKAAKTLREYPINLFLQDGIPVSVNTDNRTVSDTNLTREYMLLSGLGMDYKLMKKIGLESIKHAFIDDMEKSMLEAIVEKAFQSYL